MNDMIKIQITGYKTLFTKEAGRFLRIWKQTFIPPVITSLLYFIIFGKIIGQRVGTMGGINYIQFILPGMVMMQIMMTAYMNATFTFYSAKFSRGIEQVLVSPMTRQIMMLAYITSSALRSIITGCLVIIIGLFFTHIRITHLTVTIITIILTSILFSTLGLVNAIYARSFDDINIVPTFVITPLTYLGGVFYSIHALPILWQEISLVNPILYVINTFRYGILGVSDVAVSISLLALFILVVCAYTFCDILVIRGIGLRR